MSKVINLKAIHNSQLNLLSTSNAVSNVSKVINLKAIHNKYLLKISAYEAVSNVSKVINLKAIHNKFFFSCIICPGCFQCVKGNKFESDSQPI